MGKSSMSWRCQLLPEDAVLSVMASQRSQLLPEGATPLTALPCFETVFDILRNH